MTIGEKMEIILFVATDAALVWFFFRAAFHTEGAMASTLDGLFWEGALRRHYSESAVRLYGRIFFVGALLFLVLPVSQLAMGTFRWKGGARAYGFLDLLS